MTEHRMHDGEVLIDATLVGRLVESQHPEFAGLPIRAVAGSGTVNAIYALGEHHYVRLPRLGGWASDLTKELTWLPVLAPHLSLAVPRPVAAGRPGAGYPFGWAIYEWLPGTDLGRAGAIDQGRVALDLAAFVTELHAIDPTDAPRARRDRPFTVLDPEVRAAIDSLDERHDGGFDPGALLVAWHACVRQLPWDGPLVWTHGDLLPGNLLAIDGHLSAVIDFGSTGAGDPALDVIPAWAVLDAVGRSVFRAALDIDDATWARARGYALHQALLIIPYYRTSNPAFTAMAKRTVRNILTDA